jgi:PetM family of cytochrome b6f complex subunit 7
MGELYTTAVLAFGLILLGLGLGFALLRIQGEE